MNPHTEEILRDLPRLSDSELLMAGFLVLLSSDSMSLYAQAIRTEVERRMKVRPQSKFPQLLSA